MSMSRDAVERRILGALRPIVIALLLIVSVFPFYYMVVLSFRPLESVLQDPGALWPSFGEIDWGTYGSVLKSVDDPQKFPTPKQLFQIDEFGGWKAVNDKFFDPDKGVMAEINKAKGVSTGG